MMFSHKADELHGTDFMPETLVHDRDFHGLAAYFVDKDATEVTLCIPAQKLEGEDTIVCDECAEIIMPAIMKAEMISKAYYNLHFLDVN